MSDDGVRRPGPDTVFLPVPEVAEAEFRRDLGARRATAHQLQEMAAFAWEKGERVAREVGERARWRLPSEVALEQGLRIVTSERDGAVYSEFSSRPRLIELHRGAIRWFIDHNEAHLEVRQPDEVAELFVAHELFHALECLDPHVGLTSRQRRVVTVSWGPCRLRSGLRSLSEIAAHAFTRRYVSGTSAVGVLSATARAAWAQGAVGA